MPELESKTALVTGGSRGIGRAIAERLAEDGARVALTYVDNKDAAESVLRTIEEAHGSALALQADVSDLDSIERLFGELREHFDGLDILVNNAGRGSGGFPELVDVTPAYPHRPVIRRIRHVTGGSSSGPATGRWTRSSTRLLEISRSEGRSISRKPSSTAPSQGPKRGLFRRKNEERQGNQDHGDRRPRWSSCRRLDYECFAS